MSVYFEFLDVKTTQDTESIFGMRSLKLLRCFPTVEEQTEVAASSKGV